MTQPQIGNIDPGRYLEHFSTMNRAPAYAECRELVAKLGLRPLPGAGRRPGSKPGCFASANPNHRSENHTGSNRPDFPRAGGVSPKMFNRNDNHQSLRSAGYTATKTLKLHQKCRFSSHTAILRPETQFTLMPNRPHQISPALELSQTTAA